MDNNNDIRAFMAEAARVKPSSRQLKWFDTEFYAFVHFSPNTYTGLEWGLGDEPESIFAPHKLDCDQWVDAIKAAGMRGMILTAKHHDGFCLWPSRYTEHSVKNCPLDIDVVKLAADACRRGGIKFGFYLSPWDRNSAYYGSDAYNEYYKRQLTELLTGYGDIFCVWLDGACGEGPNGRKQVYDFDGYIELVRKYQPDAVIFQDGGPDTRWIGNEAGKPRAAEWAVVPNELARLSGKPATSPGPLHCPGAGQLDWIYNSDDDIGSTDLILRSRGLNFLGAEVDMSIRPGWFYHAAEQPHSLERLFNTYIASVGHNACFNLNVPPTPDGLFDQRDVARLRELGAALRTELGTDLAAGAAVERRDLPAFDQTEFTLTLQKPSSVKYVDLRERIAEGQRVSGFRVMLHTPDGDWRNAYTGQTIGHRQICPLSKPAETDAIKLIITSARDRVEDISIALH